MDESPKRPLHLGVMAKYWSPGSVKTRLGKSIGMENAARLHQAFCRHLANALAKNGSRRSFVVSPPETAGQFAEQLGPRWDIELQSAGDLGLRMSHWFHGSETSNSHSGDSSEKDEHANSAPLSRPTCDRILIGADCPLVSASLIETAHQELRQNDLVLGPAEDGGYFLVGFRAGSERHCDALMQDVPWSSDAVFEITRKRALERGLKLAVLDSMEDVDTIEELNRLENQLAEQLHGDSSNTLANLLEIIRRHNPQSTRS